MVKKNEPMTAAEERMSLHRHGTQAFLLPASALVTTALADLKVVKHNARVAHLRRHTDTPKDQIDAKRKTVFAAAHLKKATTAVEVLEAALRGGVDVVPANRAQAEIYGDRERLAAALEIARQRGV